MKYASKVSWTEFKKRVKEIGFLNTLNEAVDIEIMDSDDPDFESHMKKKEEIKQVYDAKIEKLEVKK